LPQFSAYSEMARFFFNSRTIIYVNKKGYKKPAPNTHLPHTQGDQGWIYTRPINYPT